MQFHYKDDDSSMNVSNSNMSFEHILEQYKVNLIAFLSTLKLIPDEFVKCIEDANK